MPTTYSPTEPTTAALMQAIGFMRGNAVAVAFTPLAPKNDPALQPK